MDGAGATVDTNAALNAEKSDIYYRQAPKLAFLPNSVELRTGRNGHIHT